MEKKILPVLRTYNYSLSARWCVEFKNEKGKRQRRYIPPAATLKERNALAENILKEVIDQVLKKNTLSLKGRIFEELENRKSTWRKKSYQTKKSKLNIFTNWMWDKEWTADNVHLFFVKYLTKEKKVAPGTHNDYIQHIKEALGWCDMQELMKNVEKRKSTPTPAAYFTETQRQYLVDSMKKSNPTLLFFIQFLYYCFIRPGTELRLLRVGDIILEDQQICIPAGIAKNKKQQYIAIPDAFLPVLKEKLKNRKPNEYLFKNGRLNIPFGVNTFPYQHRALLKRLGFDTNRYKLYSWKHTGAVAAVRAGVNVKHLQIQLRHHSLDQVDAYLRQLGVNDLGALEKLFPSL